MHSSFVSLTPGDNSRLATPEQNRHYISNVRPYFLSNCQAEADTTLKMAFLH